MPPVVRDDLTGVIPGEASDMAQGPIDHVTGEIDVFASVGAPSERRLYIVTMSEDARPLSDRAREVLGQVAPEALFANLGMFTVELTEAQAAALARRPGVAGVEEDQIVSLNIPDEESIEVAKGKPNRGGDTTSPPAAEVLDWGVKAVWGGTDRRGTLPLSYSGKVFVFDTGISASTGDLNFNQSASRDFTGSRSGFYDKNGHGTHVAGTIAAIANDKGIVGVAPGVEVVSFKVLNDRGSGSISRIVEALNQVVDAASAGDVVNMSLGGGLSAALNDAVVRAATSSKKIRFAIAAGNESIDVDSVSPASAGNSGLGIYVISAHDQGGKNARFTNFDNFGGEDVDNVAFAAPGVSIVSLAIDGSTRALSGTSMASPHFAGILFLGGVKEAGFATAYGAETVDPFAVSSYWG